MNLVALRRPEDGVELLGQEPAQNAGGGGFGAREILAMLVRRWLMISATALVVATVFFAASLFERPQYTASALVLIQPGADRVPLPNQPNATGLPESQPFPVVDSQIEVLRSPMLASRLVDALNLLNDPEWNAALPRNGASAMDYARLGEQAGRSERIRQQVVDRVRAAINVERRPTNFAVEVRVRSENPERAAQMANRLIELFLAYQLESRFETAAQANSWLATRLRELQRDLQQKEAAAEQFRIQHGLLSSRGELLTETQTTEIQESVMAARADLAEREARQRQAEQILRTGGSLESISGVVDAESIVRLRTQESEIARRQADLEQRYLDNHPAVQNVRAERRDVEAQIQTAITRLTARLRNDVEVARARLGTLQGNLNETRGQLAGNQETSIQLRELERAASATRTVYESFLQRFQELTEQGSLRTPMAQFVTRATTPTTRSSPNLRVALVLSLGLGLALGLLVGLVAEILDEGFRTGEEIERKLGLPMLAQVPRLRQSDLKNLPAASQHPAGYLIERQMSAFTEALRVLRTSILYGRADQNPQVVAVTSAVPEEGKTTVSLCLARVSALSGQRVLLVDCDLRRRSLKDVLGLEPPLGLLQVLMGEADWRQAIYVDEASGMHLLPLKDSSFTPRDVFGSNGMDKLVGELRGAYDLIVLDCAPILAVAETRIIAAMADANILVARWEKTPARAVRFALQQARESGAKNAGVVLNQVDTRVPGYGYKMQGYYTT